MRNLAKLVLNSNEISLKGLRHVRVSFEQNPHIGLELEGNERLQPSDLADFKKHRANLAELFAKSHNTVPLKRCKIYLVGWGGTGKTTLRRALKRTRGRVPLIGSMLARAARQEADLGCQAQRETVGVEVETIRRCGEEFTLWDYGGQVEYYSSYDLFLPTHNAIFVVLSSLASRDAEEREARVRFWLSFIKSCTLPAVTQKPTVVMVGSRADQVSSTQGYRQLAELLRSEFESVLRISPTAFTLDCRDDGSPTMGRLQLELVRLKKLILKDNAHRRSPEICEKIK